jgi:type II secretory ATPase GspE/PulE/Tfp pilus assembly ATPase PilB-like protein
MEMNHTIADLATSRAPLSEVRKQARAGGMRTLLEDGRRKILAGITTAAELITITQTSELIVD